MSAQALISQRIYSTVRSLISMQALSVPLAKHQSVVSGEIAATDSPPQHPQPPLQL